MKKLLTACLATILLLGCKTSLPKQVEDKCKDATELLASGLCACDTCKKVIPKDSNVVAKQASVSDTSKGPNKDVVNSGVAVFDDCDKVRKAYNKMRDSLGVAPPEAEKIKEQDNWNTLKAIHAKNLDRKCPEYNPYLRQELDNYYAVSKLENGIHTLELQRKAHIVRVEETTIQPVLVEPYYTHWYFWGFVVLAALFLYAFTLAQIYNPNRKP